MKAFWIGLLSCCGIWAAEPKLQVDLGAGESADLILVSSGEFTQGSPAEEPGRGHDESARTVRLTQDYYITRTSVTRGQWERFVKDTGYRTEAEIGTSGGFGWDGKALSQRKDFSWRNPGFPQTSDHPVCLITFPDAEAFCRWFERKSLRKTTLPTEAQWEYACRAGTNTPWHGESGDIAWHKGNSGDGTRPVTSKPPNPWGLIIGGNVSEWCLDWYAPYDPNATIDPRQDNPNLSDKPRRVLRGGSWLRDAKNTRSAARYRVDPRSRNADIGFRVVCAVSIPGPIVEAPLDAPATPPVRVEAVPPVSQPQVHVRQIDHKLPGWLCLLVPLGLLVIVIRLAMRGRRAPNPFVSTAPPALPKSDPPPVIRKTADGFWVRSRHPVGTPIHLLYWVGGESIEQTLFYQPGPDGQFIYTGTTPDKVTVSGTGDPTPAEIPPPLPRVSDHETSRPPIFPPAY
jgi:sulfatase modifying factor 1